MIDLLNFDDATLRAFIEHSVAAEKPSPWHVTRFKMYRALENLLAPHDGEDKLVASISHSQQLAMVCGVRRGRFASIDYPEYNVLKMPFADGSFHFAFADMVMEHVEGNPWSAYQEIARIVRPGGFIVLPACCPCTRWKPSVLSLRHDGRCSGEDLTTVRPGCKPGRRSANRIRRNGRRRFLCGPD